MSKKLNIIEAMKMPVGTEFEVEFKDRKKAIIKVLKSTDFTCSKVLAWDGNRRSLANICDTTLDATFIPIQQPVSFMEAIAKGKIIRLDHELVAHGSIKGNLEFITVYLGQTQESEKLKKIFLEGKWYIEESEAKCDEQ